MESRNDVHVFVIPMCLELNYDFNVLLVPRELEVLSWARNRYSAMSQQIEIINEWK